MSFHTPCPKRTRIAAAVLLLLAVPFSVFAFGAKESTGSSSQPAAQSAPVPAFQPLTLVDATGTEVTVADMPKRIVSLTLMSDEILLDLVEPERISALTTFADDAALSNCTTKAKAVSGRLTLDPERVIGLNPDLVIAASWSDAASVKTIREAGITVFLLGSPLSIDEIFTTIQTLARLTGSEKKGETLVATMKATIASVEATVSEIPADKRKNGLDFTQWGSMGAGSMWDILLTKAGIANAAIAYPANEWGSVGIGKEELIALDPDFIFLPGWIYGDATGAERFRDEFIADPALQSLSAIARKQVIFFPERLKTTTSQYAADAIFTLANLAYPEAFGK